MSELANLRLIIKKQSYKSIFLREKACVSKGLEQQRYLYLKQRLGVKIRINLLAHAFIRGIPYAKVEPNANTNEHSAQFHKDISAVVNGPGNFITNEIQVANWVSGAKREPLILTLRVEKSISSNIKMMKKAAEKIIAESLVLKEEVTI